MIVIPYFATGYVCERHEVFVNGCCDTQASKRFVCDGCLDNGCCAIYEHCVSCCLQPEKVSEL